MPSPFIGMDPYLEQPVFWSEFHSRLIVAIADTLANCSYPDESTLAFLYVIFRRYRDTTI